MLVPGLLEPRLAMVPLRRRLRRQLDCRRRWDDVRCWRDRCIFRNVARSVDRMAAHIAMREGQTQPLGIVTHSFGDWVVRAAIAKTPEHRVTRLVSLAPLMRFGFLPGVLFAVSGKFIPEVAIIMDSHRAAENLALDAKVKRLVIWSRFDESVRQVDLSHVDHVDVRYLLGTHLTLPMQPNTHRLVVDFFLGE